MECLSALVPGAARNVRYSLYGPAFLPSLGHAVSLMITTITTEAYRKLRTAAARCLLQLITVDPEGKVWSLSPVFILFFLIVCLTSYFVFSIAVLPHSPGVVYYHLLLRRETRIPGAAPFSLRIGIWDLFVHRGKESYTPTAFGKLCTTPGVRCILHASS